MASVMLRPPRHLVKAYDISSEAIEQAYGPDSRGPQDVRDSLRKVRNLLVDLELVTPTSKHLWKRFGIWDERAAA